MTFLEDYPNAVARANAFDAQVKSDASKISTDYASIVALSIRQAFGAIEITVRKNSDGSFDSSNTLTFMKGLYPTIHLPADNVHELFKQRFLAMAYVVITLLSRGTPRC